MTKKYILDSVNCESSFITKKGIFCRPMINVLHSPSLPRRASPPEVAFLPLPPSYPTCALELEERE